MRALGDDYADIERRLGVVESTVDDRYRAVAAALDVIVRPKRGAMGADGLPWTPLLSSTAHAARTGCVPTRLASERGQVQAIETIDLRNGARQMRPARAFVLAASPIETARILLERCRPGLTANRVVVSSITWWRAISSWSRPRRRSCADDSPAMRSSRCR